LVRAQRGIPSKLSHSIFSLDESAGGYDIRRGPEVVKHLVNLYKQEKQSGERFVDTVNRLGKERIKKEVEPYRSLPPFEEKPEMYYEWDENHEFKAEIGQGECAA
jgi:dissimilatory sulfite reductase (desulfoviridin) alpha/beta subunit